MARPQKSPYPRELYQSPIYQAWQNMINRCDNPNYTNFKLWGGRGIGYCVEWQNFTGFLRDMKGSYKSGLSLHRIDNNGNYSKDNCKWATRVEQARSTRNTERALKYTFKGKTRTIREWAEEYNLKRQTLHMRLTSCNWPIEKALTKKVG